MPLQNQYQMSIKCCLFTVIIAILTSSCGEDATYRQKYIELLENHVVELHKSSDDQGMVTEDSPTIDRESVMRQSEEFYVFLCGDLENLLDLRVSEKSKNQWYILYKIKTPELDEYGFNIEKSVTFMVDANQEKLNFKESILSLGLCD